MKPLPEHIEPVSANFYYNRKTQKYIHKDKIEAWLDTYWAYRNEAGNVVKAKVNYNKNLKAAKKRWDL